MLNSTTGKQDTILYHVQPGDSLSKIIRNYYGSVNPQLQNSIISQIKADNPQIIDPNKIFPGQAFLIDIPQQFSPVGGTSQQTPMICTGKEEIKPLVQAWGKATREEREWMSWMTPLLMGTGAASLSMIDTTFKTNTSIVSEIAENYSDYKDGKITKGQYDHRRIKSLHKLKTQLGPVQRLLNGNKPANEVLRISRTKGSMPTTNISNQVSRMTTYSKYASRGGLVLSAASLGIACHQIANTDDQHGKNEILVESVGAFGGGLLYGAAATLAIAVMATPVGWVGALFIGVGGALTGVGAGYGTKYLYNTKFKGIDIANITKVDQLCR